MSILRNPFKKITFEEQVKEWDRDEKVDNLKVLLKDLEAGVQFSYNGDALITGYRLVFGDEENYFYSQEIEFDWPLQHMPIPIAFQDMISGDEI